MKRVLSIIIVAVLLCTALSACGTRALVGTWSTTINGDEGEMLLRADGTGTITSNGETRPCTWTAEGDVLTVVQTIDGYQYIFLDEVTYTVKWKTLTVTNPETGNTLAFQKK
ncbi:MAG: hypothetical protein IIX28_02610 [Clostridia bacterium]|nr:hypothetical protein [Clostridia bacterium]